ncbi:hypothetical protein ACJD0Z_12890 [Flavobacteriaceae bacterium M23B6Z8]
MTEFPIKEVLLLILGTLSTFLLWRVQYQKEKIRNVESQLSDKKYQMYSELVYILFDISGGEKIGKKVSQRDLLKRILAIKKDMFIYAPDKIFKKFTDWTLEIENNNGSVNHFKVYFELMKLVRKDMGQKNTKISIDDFMLFYMQSRSEYEKFKIEHGW